MSVVPLLLDRLLGHMFYFTYCRYFWPLQADKREFTFPPSPRAVR